MHVQKFSALSLSKTRDWIHSDVLYLILCFLSLGKKDIALYLVRCECDIMNETPT